MCWLQSDSLWMGGVVTHHMAGCLLRCLVRHIQSWYGEETAWERAHMCGVFCGLWQCYGVNGGSLHSPSLRFFQHWYGIVHHLDLLQRVHGEDWVVGCAIMNRALTTVVSDYHKV